MLVIPLLFLGLLEGGLRLAGYGRPTTFFLRKQIHGTDTLIENAWFGLSYFPPALARSPSPISIPAKKPTKLFASSCSANRRPWAIRVRRMGLAGTWRRC